MPGVHKRLHKGPQKAGGLGKHTVIIKRISHIARIPFVACETDRYTLGKNMKKNETKILIQKIKKLYARWLKIFFVGCLTNAIILFFKPNNDDYLELSMLIPFIHCGAVWCVLIIYGLIGWAKLYKNEDAMYIKNNYSSIWEKLHPLGDFSVNGFASIQFLRGKYDDGNDERLNQIKITQKHERKLILGTFFLVPIIWCCNIGAVLLAKILE